MHLLILTAPSGSGKTTLARRLLADFPVLRFSVSATTRVPRRGEIPGQSYHYLSVEDFQNRIAKGEFLEWQEVYPGVFYGTLRSEIENILKQGYTPLLDIDVQGARHIKESLSEKALTIFLLPPSLETLRERLVQRGTESPAEIEKRLSKAQYELPFASHFDYVLANDQLEETYHELQAIVRPFLSRFHAL
ncbi:MAG: guanylate kinase [Bacteroidia bacterium]